MKNLQPVTVIAFSIILLIAVGASAILTLTSEETLILTPTVLAYAALTLSVAFFAAMARLFYLRVSCLNSIGYIAKRYFEQISDYATNCSLGIPSEYLPSENYRGFICEMVRKSQNVTVRQMFHQFKITSEIVKNCTFEAVCSLNHETLMFLRTGSYIDSDIQTEDGLNLAHLLAYEYEDRGAEEKFIQMALCLRNINVNFKAKTGEYAKTPLELIHESPTSPCPKTTMKILEIFDPEKSDKEIVEKYRADLPIVPENVPDDIIENEEAPDVVLTGAEEE